MSLPPNVIKIKRKRDDDTPVTFLQFDGEAKRHRSDSDWIYQRRQTVPVSPAITSPREVRPVIHVSDDSQSLDQRHGDHVSPSVRAHVPVQGPAAPSRRFHISRAMLKAEAMSNKTGSGVSKKSKTGPAIFVERSRRKIAPKAMKDRRVVSSTLATQSQTHTQDRKTEVPANLQATTRALKKPGTASRIRANQDAPARAPLPASLMQHHEQDMTKIANDLNKWVIDEIGANLESMEQERRQAQTSPFRPKPPAQRYRDRNPEIVTAEPKSKPGSNPIDVDTAALSEASDEEGDEDEWIIEEYVRIPVKEMALDVSPTDVGVLVLDGEEATALFYGPENDSDDDFAEDDEDENAENHYTADYPEDEVDSEDEYGRQAYLYRTKNASDDEEYDNEAYESSDDMVLDGDDDDDATMARIKEYMRRHAARG